jgi:hypothetical protein
MLTRFASGQVAQSYTLAKVSATAYEEPYAWDLAQWTWRRWWGGRAVHRQAAEYAGCYEMVAPPK